MIPYKYKDNLSKVKHLYDMLTFLDDGKIESLVFNLRNSICLVIKKDYFFEIEYFDTEETPEDMIFHDTSKIDFYRLMLFITDNIRVKSQIVSNKC